VFDAISGIGLGRAILTVQNLVTAGKQRNGIVGCFCGRRAFTVRSRRLGEHGGTGRLRLGPADQDVVGPTPALKRRILAR
jgi:hypothetical protein